MPPQIDFSLIKDAFKKRFPDQDLPPGMEGTSQQPTASMLGQEVAQSDMGTIPGGQAQEINQTGGQKSEAQKIVEALAARLRRLS